MKVDAIDPMRRVLLGSVSGTVVDSKAPTMAAIDRYTGVLYRELDPASIKGQARRRMQRDVMVASGLWGLVAPTDPIPYYRLKMAASVDGLGRLSTWWRDELSIALAPHARAAAVWDLLPNEHSAALNWTSIPRSRRITVRFVDRSERVVSHWNKLLKGSLVRWLVETGARHPEDLAEVELPGGYRLDPLASSLDDRRAEVVMRQHP